MNTWSVAVNVLRRHLRLSKRKSSITHFQNVMEMARDIAEKNPAALYDLVKVLLRPVQSAALVGVIENAAHEAPGNIHPSTFFFDDRRIQSIVYGIGKHLPAEDFMVRLATDVVLPWPWNRQRISSALAFIGKGKRAGEWKQDFGNHQLILWLPWGITFVGGGNHSLAVGIVAGEGELIPGEVHDMSDLLSLVHCDGQHFRETATNQIIATVRDQRVAAVFEIGRLMLAHGLAPTSLVRAKSLVP
ncbi:hypothetical protein P0D69_01635 [Paraburkholderia sediminicola]|uniref:DUF6710 family protein n=1 Tax=Paraburkholderia sediminicola TaxID=458836 RepID=UPI0038B99A99